MEPPDTIQRRQKYQKTGLDEPYDALKDMSIGEIRRELDTYKSVEVGDYSDLVSVQSFKWSDTEYTPKQLLDNFQDLTPFVVIVTEGFTGRDEWINTVSRDEVYWVRGVITLPRLVIRNEYNAYFSLPVTHKCQVVPLMDGLPVPKWKMTVQQLYDNPKIKTFRFAGDSTSMYAYQGPGEGERVSMSRLEVVDRYEERYLRVHSLISGLLDATTVDHFKCRFWHEPCVVPSYMPVTLSIAVNASTGNHNMFYRAMLAAHRFISRVPRTVAFPREHNFTMNSEITMYDKPPSDGTYDTLNIYEPRYVRMGKNNPNQRAAVQSAHIYDKIIADNKQMPLPPVPNRTYEVRKLPKEPEPDKVRKSTPPPGPTIDQHGGSRGPNTNIYPMGRQGYVVVDVNPREAIKELNRVLQTGLVPEVSHVRMATVSKPPVVRKPAPTERVPSTGPAPTLPHRTLPREKQEANRKFMSFKDIPRDISRLSCDEICECLNLLNLSRYRDIFKDDQVDGNLLVDCDTALLQESFNMNKFEALKLDKFVKGWRPQD